MITVPLKQTITRRSNRRPTSRFTLLVGGKVRGVWERKASVATLIVRRPGASLLVDKRPFAALLRLLRKHGPLAAGAAFAVVLAAAGGIGAAAFLTNATVQPLDLPADRAILALGRGGQEEHDDAEEEAAEVSVAPLVLKKLKTSSYRVTSGESLLSIAKKTGLTVDTLISFNALTDARSVTAGTMLVLPNHSGLRYRVRRGDTLSSISRRFKVSLNDLLDWNNLPDSSLIVGRTLFIPGGRLGAAAVKKVLGTLFTWPAKGKISSLFGMRISPITGTRMHHNGIDIANNIKTPVRAAADGKVALVDYNPTYGHYVILVHENGFQTLYGHLHEVGVKPRETVTQGQYIGAMGSSGASTGTHLHFSVFKNGRDVDPLRYLR